MTVTPAPTTIGAAISAFAATTRFDVMPAAVQGFGRLLFVDTLGALLGGLRYPPVRRWPLAHGLGAGRFGVLLRPTDDPRYRRDLAGRRLRRVVPPTGAPATPSADRTPGTPHPARPPGRRRPARPRRRGPPRGLPHRRGGRDAQRRRLVAAGRTAPARRARARSRSPRDRPPQAPASRAPRRRIPPGVLPPPSGDARRPGPRRDGPQRLDRPRLLLRRGGHRPRGGGRALRRHAVSAPLRWRDLHRPRRRPGHRRPRSAVDDPRQLPQAVCLCPLDPPGSRRGGAGPGRRQRAAARRDGWDRPRRD